MHAVRNISLCSKDCLCLYVCPTGASDTENGQVDASKCIGCGKCAMACPSHAIVMVPEEYPKQQDKSNAVEQSLKRLAESKTVQEQIARDVASKAATPIEKQFASAIAKSNRVMAEDIFREAGYMLPQSEQAGELLHNMLAEKQPEDFPKEAAQELITLLHHNKERKRR
ncbi:MAG TPA: 4Fe-4S binding protein [Lachnospiraceae bacterium]|jgi:Fe-S-cluster-containing hydrogenase component 2|nr:4Fe-4S binding protein [Lachnospiraceae bacterium]